MSTTLDDLSISFDIYNLPIPPLMQSSQKRPLPLEVSILVCHPKGNVSS